MKKLVCILLSMALILGLSSCSEKNSEEDKTKVESTQSKAIQYYENCIFTNLKTFTEITGVELVSSEEELKAAICTYNANDVEDAEKYERYLVEEYGFAADTEGEPDEGESLYVYNDYELIITQEETADGITVTVTYPYDEDTLNAKKEEVYQECLKLFGEEKYAETLEYCKGNAIGEYKDFLKIWNYCEASLMLEEDEFFYSEVIDNLSDASGLKDADVLKAELEEELKSIEGVYYYKRSGDWLITNYYCIISGGKAAMELKENKLDMDDSVFYLYDVLKIKLLDADGNPILNEDGSPAWAVGIGHRHTSNSLLKCEYKCTMTDSGMKIQVFGTVQAFEGTYKKISETVPAAR